MTYGVSRIGRRVPQNCRPELDQGRGAPVSHYTVQTVGRARNALAVGRDALARTGCDKEFS
jgi:hypothetical protein